MRRVSGDSAWDSIARNHMPRVLVVDVAASTSPDLKAVG